MLVMSMSGMFDNQDHSVREQAIGLVNAELAVSVVATSRRKTGLWTGGKTILGWHAGMKQVFHALITCDHVESSRKFNDEGLPA
jgi:hypothetical protein